MVSGGFVDMLCGSHQALVMVYTTKEMIMIWQFLIDKIDKDSGDKLIVCGVVGMIGQMVRPIDGRKNTYLDELNEYRGDHQSTKTMTEYTSRRSMKNHGCSNTTRVRSRNDRGSIMKSESKSMNYS